MNTPLYPPHKYPNLFRGTFYENRRQSLPARQKPVIRKLAGCDTWVCRGGGSPNLGFGLTPTQAYNAWKRA